MAVVTNIDADHMETYGHDFGRLKRAFVDFVQRLPFYGVAVLCVDDPHGARDPAARSIRRPSVSYGLARGRAAARGRRAQRGRPHALRRAAARTRRPRRRRSHSPASTTCATRSRRSRSAARSASPTRAIAKALADFKGVGRRFQRYGDVTLDGGGAFTLVDDYGHHPVEMAATIAAARGSFPGRRLVLAFQPHRYTRTRDLFEDFARVLSTVDALVLADVYPAGETPIVAADGRALARAVRVAGRVEPLFVETIGEMPAAIRDGRARRRRRADDGRRVDRRRARAARDSGRAMMMHEPLRFDSAPRNARARCIARAVHELARGRPRRPAVHACRPRRPRRVRAPAGRARRR